MKRRPAARRIASVARLAPLDRKFLPVVREWILSPETRELVGTIRPPNDVQHERWYETLQTDRTRHTCMVLDARNGRPLGICGLIDINEIYRNAELWIYLGESAKRRTGAGRSAVVDLLAFAFDTLGLHRVYVHVFGFNAAAHAFFARCGFKDEGVEREAVFKRRRFHDVWLMGILDREIRLDA